MRRPSFGSRKPPCLFFPSGRCKNGYEILFGISFFSHGRIFLTGMNADSPIYFQMEPPCPHN
jgi:hypothetical protein